MQHRAYSKESLVAFLESRDPDERYTYLNVFNCLHAQYWAFLGRTRLAYGLLFLLVSLLHHKFELVAAESPHTFGAALDRVRKTI